MNICIRYFTKSKKGNTEKIAKFVSEKLNVPALDIANPIDEDADILFLINAMYAADIDKRVKTFLADNKDRIKRLVNVSSSASGKSTYKAVKKVCDKYGISISDYEYHTVASWIFINKGRPNEDDFKRLNGFLNKVVNE